MLHLDAKSRVKWPDDASFEAIEKLTASSNSFCSAIRSASQRNRAALPLKSRMHRIDFSYPDSAYDDLPKMAGCEGENFPVILGKAVSGR